MRGLAKGRRQIRFGDDLLNEPWFKAIVA